MTFGLKPLSSERQAQPDAQGARRLHSRREARGRTSDRKLFDFGGRVQQVVGIEKDGKTARAEREAFLQA